VLAAGFGSRLKSDTPKPLFRILGLPLLSRALHTLARGGVREVHVVVGFEADRIRREMERYLPDGLQVHWIFNPEWEEPNGVSVLSGEGALTEPFFLAMSDHLFSVDVLEGLASSGSDGINLAVDFDVEGVSDLDDAVKVEVADGRIVAIGKALDHYDAIDTGVFLATPAIFSAIRDARAEGQSSLSAGVQRLASAGLARVTDVGGGMWHDVDTPADVREAKSKLIAGLRKDTDGWVARYINRPLSISLSRLLVHTPVTPNQISFSTLVLSVVGAVVATAGGYVDFLVAAVLFQLASVIDGTDGEVAKLKFLSSAFGEWVDTVCDNIAYLAFLAGLIVGVQRGGAPDLYVYLGILGLVASGGSIANLTACLAREGGRGTFLAVQYGHRDGTGFLNSVFRAAHFAGKRDFLAFFALVIALVGQLPLALPIFGVGASLLLFPATLQANLSSWLRHREPARPTITPETEPGSPGPSRSP
jgi:CDP-L-myo-inositol myo-inositolphosphotransferase